MSGGWVCVSDGWVGVSGGCVRQMDKWVCQMGG